jgi:HPt (histidine-containing phosphotransfer) domain-containing protein
MNTKGLAENLDLEEDEYIELLNLFLDTTRENLTKLKSGVDANNTRQVVEAAHTIKGSAANLGLEKIAAVAQAVEMNARQSNLEGADKATTIINEHCARMADELKPN